MGEFESLTEGGSLISDLIDEDDATGEGLRKNAAEISDIANTATADVFEDLHDEEGDDFEWVKFNKLALKAVVKRVHQMVPKFMKIADIADVNDLSLANPAFEEKVKYYVKVVNWWTFVTQIIRDIFPEFRFEKYKVNRIDFANLIIKEVIIPIALLKKGQIPKLDFERIEEEFNELLSQKLKNKRTI